LKAVSRLADGITGGSACVAEDSQRPGDIERAEAVWALQRSLDPAGSGPGVERMILLTRLNNRPLVVNSDMIKFIENTPDTVLTLVSGEKIVVHESVAEVMEAIMSFRARIVATAGPLVRGPDTAEKKRDERGK
jgi:uncharacterized protein YlzI (FlbEa/FlbD family)